MRVCCISDTHGKIIPDEQMPDASVLIHAGDITNNGKIYWLQMMAEWFRHLVDTKYEHIVVVGGNHDFILDAFRKEDSEWAIPGIFGNNRIHYLRDSGVTLNFMGGTVGRSLHFYGTPWVNCGDWAFSETDRLKRRDYFNRIPLHTNVLVTHGPPYSILDRCDNGSHGFGSVGDLELLGATERVRPSLHVFGHIHESYGVTKIGQTTFVNAASTRIKSDYELGNEPIVIDI